VGNFAAVGGIRVLGRTDYLSSEARPFSPKAYRVAFGARRGVNRTVYLILFVLFFVRMLDVRVVRQITFV
jgi:hypothetical protein